MIIYIIFFFNDTATTEIYTLSLHDALPIYVIAFVERLVEGDGAARQQGQLDIPPGQPAEIFEHRPALQSRCRRLRVARSEEHTSELQSRQYLVCRLLLYKKNAQLSTLRFLL